jgi:hypothetical protein
MNKYLRIVSVLSLSLSFLVPALANHPHRKRNRIDLGNIAYDDSYRFRNYNCNYRPRKHRAKTFERGYCKQNFQTKEQIQACQLSLRALRVSARHRVAPNAVHDGLKNGLNCGISYGSSSVRKNRYRQIGSDLRGSLLDQVNTDPLNIIETYARIPAKTVANHSAKSKTYTEFRSALRENRKPNQTKIQPDSILNYQGIDNAYEKYGYRVPNMSQMIDELYDDGYMRVDEYIDEIEDLADWHRDIWNKPYQYSQYSSWSDWNVPSVPRHAMDKTWLRLVSMRSRYMSRPLKNLVAEWRKLSDKPIEVPNPNYQAPVTNPDGSVTTSNTPKTILIESPKAVFKAVFNDLYTDFHYQIYHRILERSLDEGFDVGKIVGREAGESIAIREGEKKAFDRKFRDKSIPAYRSSYESSFSQFATQHFEDLMNRSELENFNHGLVPGKKNGILTPGESIAFRFSLDNIGGQKEVLKASASINNSKSSKTNSFEIDGVSTNTFVTEALISVPQNIIPKTDRVAQIRLGFEVNQFVRTEVLNVFNESGYDLNTPSAQVERLQLELPVKIVNPSNIQNAKESTLNLYVDGALLEQKKLGKLQPGTQSLSFYVQKDLFDMLDATYSLQLELVYGDEVIQASNNMTVNINKRQALKTYWNALVNLQTASTPDAQSPKDYRDRLVSYLSEESKKELDSYLVEAKDAVDDSKSSKFKNRNDIWDISNKRADSNSPSIITEIYLLSPHLHGKKHIEKMSSMQEESYQKLGSYLAMQLINVSKKADEFWGISDRKQTSKERLMNTTCDLADIARSLYQNETLLKSNRTIEFYLSSQKQLYYCSDDRNSRWRKTLKRKYKDYFKR